MMACCSKELVKLGESTLKPNWLELPIDITEDILHRLGIIQILKSARNVCRLWWNICKDPLMWRTIHMSDIDIFCYGSIRYLVKLCCYAIDLSCGHLKDISIDHFGNDNLLQHIAYRARNLRCIWLRKCGGISDKGLSEAAKNLPLLEELRIEGMFLSKDSLEVIGQCCPLLKSLIFGSSWNSNFRCDDEAFAIAKTMPRLRHLDVTGNPLTDVGLFAIADGCPLLKSVYLRECFYISV